ncbi:major facilitator superfamily MFS_1 [Tolumonas auensis DSM 9187]|uniref:Major facilitator superfamily MFS_1 n=1 Tax=Tolumonas auensis (strain DSM 9187 / NBRC 110442 / TA 4) TaxID=595494 RepID=C4L834_TOLAT|nr:MFS transporter [Tolumonas auensis]ACQ93680.1 major facilitator superfamily MFS_1 [Tolumonas auensis DSM 9187]
MHDNQMTATERRATVGLGAVFALRMFGMFMVLPVLTTYGMALQGANESLIGLAIGIYGLMQALFQIPVGLLSDKFGRFPLIIGGLLLFLLGSVLAACADSIWGVIIGRALQGAGAISAAVMALLSDLTREQHRTKAMAFIGVSIGITFAVAMVLGPVITHAFGLSALFWGTAGLTGLAIITTLFFIPKPQQHVLNRESAFVSGNLRAVLMERELLKLNFSIFSLHALLMASFVALPVAMEQAGFQRQLQWQVYLVTMLISFVAVVPFIIYAEKRRRIKQVFISCILIFLLAEAVLFSAGLQLWFVFAGIQLFFIGFNVLEGLLPSLVSKIAPAGYKGTAMGLYSTSQFLGVAAGGASGGWLLQLNGTPLVFLAGIVIVGLWLLVSLTMREPPYVSSLRIVLPDSAKQQSSLLAENIKAQPGVADVVLVLEEMAAYVKVDTRQTSRRDLEQIVAAAS